MQHIASTLRHAAVLGLFAFFAFHAVQGQYGYLALASYQEQLPAARAQAAALAAERAALEHRIALLNPQATDPDLLDEMARRRLGYVHPDEILIPLQTP